MTAPTFVAEYEASSWSTTSTPKTVSVTTAVGDVLVVVALGENQLGTLATPTGGTGLTWTLRQQATATPTSDWSQLYVWTATATTAQTFTMSIARSGTAIAWGFICYRYSGSTGIGATAKTNVSGGAPSLDLTTTADDSAIVIGNSDWNAVDGASRTWRSVNGAAATEQAYFRGSTTYAIYSGRHVNAGAAGVKTVGLSAPSGQKYTIVAVEVLGTASGSTTVTPTGIASGQAIGTPSVTPGAVTITPTGVGSGGAVGTPAASTTVTVAPSGVTSGAAVGTPAVSTTVTVSPTGIASGAGIGTPSISGTQTVTPSGIASGATVGSPTIAASITVAPGGVTSGQALGTPTVSGSVTASPTGVASSAAVGSPTATFSDPDLTTPWSLLVEAPMLTLTVDVPAVTLDVETGAAWTLDVQAPGPESLAINVPALTLEVDVPALTLEIET